MEVKTKLYLDKRRKKVDGTYPVKLVVTFFNKRKRYSTGFSFREPDWEDFKNKQCATEVQRHLQDKLDQFHLKVNKVIREMPAFNFMNFEKKVFQLDYGKDVYLAFEEYINDLKKQERFGTAHSYNNMLQSLKKFQPNLVFFEITPEFLMSYERWMLAQGRAESTTGIYIRSLRVIYNKAIADGAISRDYYPFGKYKY